MLQHLDGRVKTWHNQHENLKPSCLLSVVHAGDGVMVCGILAARTSL